MSEFCWCCARWGITRAATGLGGCCDTCGNRSPSACERIHKKEAQGA